MTQCIRLIGQFKHRACWTIGQKVEDVASLLPVEALLINTKGKQMLRTQENYRRNPIHKHVSASGIALGAPEP